MCSIVPVALITLRREFLSSFSTFLETSLTIISKLGTSVNSSFNIPCLSYSICLFIAYLTATSLYASIRS